MIDPMLAALDEKIPAPTRGLDVVAFFANHPSKVRSIQFWVWTLKPALGR